MTILRRWLMVAMCAVLCSLAAASARAREAPPAPPPPQEAPSPGEATPANPHGGAEMPVPGQPFALRDRPAGTLVVGTISQAGPIGGIEVTLTIAPPKRGDEKPEPLVRRATSDGQGRALFERLLPPEVPEGSQLVVTAKINPDGEPLRAGPFKLGNTGVAVVLADGFMGGSHASEGPTRSRVPPPRRDRSLPSGTVRLRLIDAKEEAVPGQQAQLVRRDMSGTDTFYEARTGPDGVALFEDVGVQEDAIYRVDVTYDGGPYRSRLFELSPAMGTSVDLQVFETTSELTSVKSAVTLEVRPQENDLLHVIQVQELMVEGEKAFWPAEGLEVRGVEGSTDFTVLRRSEAWLEHREGAPFATLAEPIPPKEVIQLSVGYVLDHDGTAQLRWTPPVPLAEATIVVPRGLALDAKGATPVSTSHAAQNVDIEVYRLGPHAVGSPLEVAVSGLPVRPRVLRRIGAGVSLAMIFGVVLALALRPQRTTRQQLLEHRDELLGMLDEVEKRGGEESEKDRIVAVLDRIYRQLDAIDPSSEVAKTREA